MKSFNTILNEIKSKIEPDYESEEHPYLYHATLGQHARKIKKEGLKPNSSSANYEDSKKGVVYFAKSPHVALSYAEEAEHNDFEKPIHIFKVKKEHLIQSNLHKDVNVKDDNSTLEYHGSIKPEHIELHKKVEQ